MVKQDLIKFKLESQIIILFKQAERELVEGQLKVLGYFYGSLSLLSN